MSDLIERLREADVGSVQRTNGSRIFGEAADALTTANETIARLERSKLHQKYTVTMQECSALERTCYALEQELATKESELLACRADAERWRTLPMFLEDYQINYMALLNDIDDAIKAGAQA